MAGEDRPMPEARPGGARGKGGEVDPTRNVLDLVRAAIQRQDDLREAEAKAWEAKFAAIQHEFDLIESRRIEQKTDTKVAVDAALSAAEKAVKEQAAASEKSILKSETAAADQSRQQTATFTASLKGVTDTLSDLKERVGKIENVRQGHVETKAEGRASVGLVISVVVAGVSFIGMLLTIAAFIASRGTGP